jgi:nitroreductase
MSITDAIQARYSVRQYQAVPVAEETQAGLMKHLQALQTGPLGSHLRFSLFAATEADRASLRGLGTYGFIKDPTGFIVGAVQAGDHALEDFGYMMEKAILDATALGLGTCWLGGSFTQSSFARKIGKGRGEMIPAVTSIGYPAPDARERDQVRVRARADSRLPWEALFFDSRFGKTLSRDRVGAYAKVLDMVRIGPSASNKQPWRIVKDGARWHFYCQRTPGYGKGSWYFTLLRLADLQRLDVGIAMCHFELTARELGLGGKWMASDPGLEPIDEKTLYVATWQED